MGKVSCENERRHPESTGEVLPNVAFLEVVTVISLMCPAEKAGAEPGKRDCLSNAEKLPGPWLVTLPKARGLEFCASSAGLKLLRGTVI